MRVRTTTTGAEPRRPRPTFTHSKNHDHGRRAKATSPTVLHLAAQQRSATLARSERIQIRDTNTIPIAPTWQKEERPQLLAAGVFVLMEADPVPRRGQLTPVKHGRAHVRSAPPSDLQHVFSANWFHSF